MTGRAPLTEDELAALATAIQVAPLGFTLDVSRTEDRAVCDGLVERGSLVAVDDVDGGYRASDELQGAMGQQAANN